MNLESEELIPAVEPVVEPTVPGQQIETIEIPSAVPSALVEASAPAEIAEVAVTEKAPARPKEIVIGTLRWKNPA